MCPAEEEQRLFSQVQELVKIKQGQLDMIAAAIPSLQLDFISLACNDPGPRIASDLVLPLLQERLQTLADEWVPSFCSADYWSIVAERRASHNDSNTVRAPVTGT